LLLRTLPCRNLYTRRRPPRGATTQARASKRGRADGAGAQRPGRAEATIVEALTDKVTFVSRGTPLKAIII